MIKVFFISSSEDHLVDKKIRSKFLSISKKYNLYFIYNKILGYKIYLLATNKYYKFSKEIIVKNEKVPEDRFIKINLEKNIIKIVNDFYGSIPVFYQKNNKDIYISNLESLILEVKKNKFSDISFENLFSYLKFGHYVYNETLWNNVFQMLPDHSYIFKLKNDLIKKKYLSTLKASTKRKNYSNNEVINELYELNKSLVDRSFKNYEKIILPLSSGFDCRMIFSVIANSNYKDKLHCFSYGSPGSIDLESAKNLCKLKKVNWSFIDINLKHLNKNYFEKNYELFGPSLHMHGMYCNDFIEQISKKIKFNKKTALTTGFMTGVPAGQHIKWMNHAKIKNLTESLEQFGSSQSFYSNAELKKVYKKDYIKCNKILSNRLKKLYNLFNGNRYQKLIMFDNWTRQRNFISFHPRLFNMYIDTVSPHANKEYANFFLSLSDKYLIDRKAVQLLLIHKYKKISSIPTNSVGITSISSNLNKFFLKISAILNNLKLYNFLPKQYQLKRFELDMMAIKKSKKYFSYPVETKNINFFKLLKFLNLENVIKKMINNSVKGNMRDYSKITLLQSIAYYYKSLIK